MSTFLKVLLIILVVLVVALVVLYFVGRRMQKKQAAQEQQMEAAKQTVSMLIIDKKMMPLKESGLPQMVIDQTPKLMRRSKLPIVKAKVGPRVMTLVADSKIFDDIPVKREIKAVVSGIYITEVKSVRGGAPAKEKSNKKPKLRDRLASFASRKQKELDAEEKQLKGQKAKKAKKA
ncbi:MAG: hypothetical protein LUI14_00010 [Lachnospiraceae bacterium]|nr:hypothetical protein [Lachnospiraceae bacterium]MCD7765177.1 hypothetical protein [Lachnospiraceae bacterium]